MITQPLPKEVIKKNGGNIRLEKTSKSMCALCEHSLKSGSLPALILNKIVNM